MNSSESLSFLKVIGDDDFERESERRCLQSRHNQTNTNTRLIDTILSWKRSRYVCALCATLLLIICGLSFLFLNNYKNGLNQININLSKEKLKHNGSDVDLDELPLSPFEQAVMVDTICGKVIGTVEDGAFAFKVNIK